MSKQKKKHGAERVFAVPAEMLEKSIHVAEHGEHMLTNNGPVRRAGEYWSKLGPGLTTGAADNDPSGIATYSQAGAQFGFQFLWTPLFTLPFMAVVQEMCARIGIVSGRGLAANIRSHYSSGALYLVTILLFIANTLNIAADLGAMAAGAHLLIPLANIEILVIIFAFISLLLQIFTSYAHYAKYLKYLTLALFSYVITAFAVNLDWTSLLYHTVIPSFSLTKSHIFLLGAILGTTISPYLFFWQTSQEVEERVLHGETSIKQRQKNVNDDEIKDMRVDVWSGMFFSNLIAFFIFAACAGTLYTHGIVNIETAADAASALRPFAGEFAYLLFAIGIIGTGLLAIPVLAGSTAYAIAESFGWRYGLYRKLKQAYAFYGVIIISMIIGVIANFMHLDPIKGLLYAALANGIIAPVVLFFVIRISGNKKVMGRHHNKRTASFIGWVTVVVMAVSGIAAMITLI
ncbi:Manganese transport protein MntH [hydrothermal vent metagenome]|uniref:Manganese transport protein MntH n=1 Tax=hydrothermal vent metagenome TaxID=652676 RepID=A0A3B0VLM3_9ZZZZ